MASSPLNHGGVNPHAKTLVERDVQAQMIPGASAATAWWKCRDLNILIVRHSRGILMRRYPPAWVSGQHVSVRRIESQEPKMFGLRTMVAAIAIALLASHRQQSRPCAE